MNHTGSVSPRGAIAATWGSRSSRKIVATAENDSICETPMTFWNNVPSALTIQRITPM